jgi:predicted peptidase
MKPIDYKPGKKYPLVVFLHGAGERGDDNLAQLKHAAKDFALDERRRQYPAYVLFPQCPKDKKWVDVDWSKETSQSPEKPNSTMALVKALTDTMIETAGIDESRIYITGLSMGGFGTWDAIGRYDGLFAAAAPICGGGDPQTVQRFVDLPIWCFHGAKDKTVPVRRSQEMIEALKARGGSPKYTEYPNAQHDSWSETYSNPAFYEWLFAQMRS